MIKKLGIGRIEVFLVLIAIFCMPLVAAEFPPAPYEPVEGSTQPLSPADAMRAIHLPPGYRLQLVASEPMIREPVMCIWDGNGNMYVAEMRSYTQDLDGTGTRTANSRVRMLRDIDGDGVMDEATTFIDNLVLPRMILPLDDRILVNETYSGDFYAYRDVDGDGVADSKEVVYRGNPSESNLEHQDSALTWNIDNWMYTAFGGRRHRFTDGTWRTQELPGEFAQWGLAMDDTGRMFFSAAGAERPAYNFQSHPRYGLLTLPGELVAGFNTPYPRVKTPDVQGGPGRIKPDGSLNHFTAGTGQSVFRGDALPPEIRGDYLLCEPVGRLVRRAKVTIRDGKYILSNAYDKQEFITSTDMNFRPIWSATGPDGCLYLVDMYRGVIQESNWTGTGSYLRGEIQKLGLEKNVQRGRIYRVVHEDYSPGRAPRMLEQDTAELVRHLAAANGWTRDTAQKLIVLRGDTSVLPELLVMMRSHENPLARLHALWTIEGLGQLTRAIVEEKLSDADGRLRAAAIRMAEAWLDPKSGGSEPAAGQATNEPTAMLEKLLAMVDDADAGVRVQLVQSLRYAKDPRVEPFVIDFMTRYAGDDLAMAAGRGTLSHGKPQSGDSFAHLDAETLKLIKAGREHYNTLCIACHGPDGKGMPAGDLRLAPPLQGSVRLATDEAAIRITLHGMQGPLDGKNYPNVMAPLKDQSDAYLAAVLTYARNSFGNAYPAVSAQRVAEVRKQTADRAMMYTAEEIAPFVPVARSVMQRWKLDASHNRGAASRAIDGEAGSRWDSGTSQVPGMWFSMDLLSRHAVRRIILDTRGSNGDYPRGYEVRISNDGREWSEPIVAGKGSGPVTEIELPAETVTRHVRIVQTGGVDGLFWSIHEMTVFASPVEE